jgi:hypothetical protein
MKRIEVIHNGKRKSIPENEAKVLLLLKKATLASAPVAIEPPFVPTPVVVLVEPAVAQEDDAPTSVESAEVTHDAQPCPDEAAAEVEISLRTGKPKRQYRRRDLTAEE